MASRPIAGSTFTFEADLVSQANTKIFQVNPTLASGDFKRSINGGAFANLDNLPTVTNASFSQIQFVMSTSETTSAAAGGRIKIQCLDASGAEWCSLSILLFVFATDNDSLATAAALATVQADTDDIQTRLPAALVSGRIDASVGAMAANVVTASAIAADAIGASELAADAVTEIQSGLSTLTAAGVRTAVGLATANLDTQLDALPTNSELTTALGTADDATLAAIAALNNISAAQVNTEVDTAIADVGLTTTITGRIDAAISTRLATAGYTAPDNADIVLIKAKTDNLPANTTTTLSTLQTSVDDIPTNAELATSQAAADDATLAAIAAISVPTVADILAGVIEGSITFKGAMRLMLAVLAGKSSGGGTSTITFRDVADAKARVTATVTVDGNRTAITRDITD